MTVYYQDLALVEHSPLREMDAAGSREAALWTCLLSFWNFALSADPFNCHPAFFVQGDVGHPAYDNKWSDIMQLLLSYLSLLSHYANRLPTIWWDFMEQYSTWKHYTDSSNHTNFCVFLFSCHLYLSLWGCTDILVPSSFSQRGAICAGGLW